MYDEIQIMSQNFYSFLKSPAYKEMGRRETTVPVSKSLRLL